MDDDKEFFKVTLNSIGDGVIITDLNGDIKMLNSVAEELTGWKREEAKGKPLDEVFRIINKQTGEDVEGPFSNVIIKGSSVGLKNYSALVARDGKQIFVSASSAPIRNENKEMVGIVVVFRNITRIKQAEEKLENEQKNLKAIFNSAPIGMLILDADAKVCEVNNSALEIFMTTRPDILEKRFGDAFICKNSLEDVRGCGYGSECSKCQLRNSLNKVITTGEPVNDITSRQTFIADGIERSLWFKINIVAINISEQRHVVVVLDDITATIRNHDELKRSKEEAEAANKAKSEFLANMSHEIRTPLNGIIGMIAITLLGNTSDEQKENLSIAKNCADSLLRIINDILDFSKIEAGKMVIEKIGFNLRELVEKVVTPHAIAARDKGLSFDYSIQKEIPDRLTGDPSRLQQILNNLIGNAVKFTQTGGIALTIEKNAEYSTYVDLKFTVKDSGIGISNEEAGRLFKSFSQVDGTITRKFGGTGLGLAISKQLVEMMGGSIWLQSQKGKGSEFYFTVLLESGDAVKEEDKPLKPDAASKSEKSLNILLVEDEVINQLVTNQMLDTAGHATKTVCNGKEALKALEKEPFDLILMDIQMPEMDGIETTNRIRESEKATGEHIPIIALTAHALQGDMERFIAAGMDYYISKPVQIDELLNSIEKIHRDRDKLKKNVLFEENGKASGDRFSVYNENYKLFHKDAPVFLGKMKTAIRSGRYQEVENSAHTLKNYASNIEGMNNVKNLCFKIELASRKSNLSQIRSLFEKLEETINKLLSSVEEE